MGDETRFRRRVLGLRPRTWLTAGLVVLVGLAVVGVGWMVATSTGIADRAWWAWNGWPAIAGLAQVAAGAAVLATLWFFWQQLKGIRAQTAQVGRDHEALIKRDLQERREDIQREARQRRDDYERENTPILALVRTTTASRQTWPPPDCVLVASGKGVAYNVIVNMWIGSDGPTSSPEIHTFSALHAPAESPITTEWPVPETPENAQPIRVQIRFLSMFGKQIGYEQTGRYDRNGLHVTEPPRFFEGSEYAPGLDMPPEPPHQG